MASNLGVLAPQTDITGVVVAAAGATWGSITVMEQLRGLMALVYENGVAEGDGDDITLSGNEEGLEVRGRRWQHSNGCFLGESTKHSVDPGTLVTPRNSF